MSDTDRPNPDALLASIQAADAKSRRGRLKIFFGMCPGVGKTYAMLGAARQAQHEGCEVVVGIVETHGRVETQALLKGLPIVPRLQIEHRGAMLEELDLDAILLWHPRLALIDELAHHNATGSRHPKRYQDVLELLDAGIDVFTTLNVQHVESRTDTVRQVTGVRVRETVPDSILDAADEIVLLDLTPEQLRQRLKEGRVYFGARATAASENFFSEGNLTALREMALRLTAEHVDRQLRTLRTGAVGESWHAGDRLLVAVSASAHSAELVRWTRRYAGSLEAPWIAVAVELPRPLGPVSEKRRMENLALARQLGAEVVLSSGAHVGEALLKAAQEHGATQIILGKPEGPPWRWILRHRSPVGWLLRHSGGIDIQLVRTLGAAPESRGKPERTAPDWTGYAAAVGIVLAVTLFSSLAQRWIGYWSVALIYLLAVMVAGTVLRRGPTLLLATLSALLWNYLFIPPILTLYIREPQDFMMFLMFFAAALIFGHMTTRLRERERIEHRREQRSTALYQLTRELAAAGSHDAAVRVVMTRLAKAFGLNAAALLRGDGGVFDATAHPASTWALPLKEEGVAAWAFQKRQPAGRTTATLPDSAGLYLPLLVADRIEGVLAIELDAQTTLPPEQRELIETFATQLAVVAEKERLADAHRNEQVIRESEKLQKTLFDSVSHELKTPIAAISAALDQPVVNHEEIRSANERLHRTVEHLLDATRLESGTLKLIMEWCDPAELAADGVKRAGVPADQIEIVEPGELPSIRVDAGLIGQALATLLHNAVTHGNSNTRIQLRISREKGVVSFEVADRGPGLPPGLEERVFEKFFRAPGSSPGGVGLGLSIARRLVEAHGGTLRAENRSGGGARFIMHIPTGGELHLPV